MDPQRLLEQFLGPDAGQSAAGAAQTAKGKLKGSGLGGVAGGLAAGGLLGVLLGNKKARKKVGKLAGGVVGYGGAAALGALAYRAYSNWQSDKQAPQAGTPAPAPAPASARPAGKASRSAMSANSQTGRSKRRRACARRWSRDLTRWRSWIITARRRARLTDPAPPPPRETPPSHVDATPKSSIRKMD